MRDTPRTDDLEFEIQGDFVVLADECREIERELNAVRMATGCTRGQRTTQFCAELQDAVTEAYERAAQACEALADKWTSPDDPDRMRGLACADAIRALRSK